MTNGANSLPRRRDVLSLLGAGALAAAVPPARADEASPVTPDLVEAAKREGQVMFLSAADVLLMQKIANAFQAKYPWIKVDAQRTGSERIFQRLDQEYGSDIHVVDVVESSDAAHFLVWKERGWLAQYVPEDVARFWSPADRDKDGLYASFRTSLSAIGVNTKLVKDEARPTSFEDLLDPRWRGKMVKAHPGYSGVVMT